MQENAALLDLKLRYKKYSITDNVNNPHIGHTTPTGQSTNRISLALLKFSLATPVD